MTSKIRHTIGGGKDSIQQDARLPRHGAPLLPVYIFGEGQAYKIALGDIGRAFARWT